MNKRTAPAFRRRPVLMATAAVVALMGLPTGPARAQEPGAALQDGGAPAVAGGAGRPRGEGVVREPLSAALPRIARDALPRDPNVVAGGATFDEDGSRLDINQSTDRVVIDWRSFDIGQDAEVSFHQPGTSSIAVNRISQGGVPSQIQGVLRANGAVVILNPNGVIFSATSRVDVGGLVASTGGMDVGRFMAGSNRLDFTDAAAGEIVTGGSINIADAGLAAFVAPHVRNDGVINARLGRVALASGETFTLDLAGDRLIELGLGAHSPLVENFGSILVDGGRVQLSAVAAGAVVDQVINAGGLISVASARAEGGAIVLEGANGGVAVSGELNASGATGGGDITVGGATVRTTPNAVMRADATAAGDGGSIVSIAGGAGTYAGALSARGGAAGGDGGFVETSGKTVSLDAGLRVDTTAADGVNGSWSIDPEDLVIGAGEAAAVVASLSTTNVVLQAQNSISIDSLINSSAQSNANTLSLNDEGGAAGLTVNLNAAIRLGVNQRLLGQATQVNVRNGGVIQNAVDVALANAGILIGAGDYVGGTIINKNGLTLTGQAGARIVMPETPELNGVTINADNVTVQGLEIVGPATGQSYLTYGWSGITRGIFAMNGADDFTIANNNIHGVRTGILVDGRNAGGSITSNIIDNTKSGVSVQYTDAGLLNAEGFAVNIAGNSEGPFGNEWGFNFHLNGHQTPGGLVGNAVKIAPTASMAVQQALLAVAAANGGMSAQDQGYSFANRTAVWVGTAGNNANQGSRLAQLAGIQAGIDAVVAGGKVNVGAGTYAGVVQLSKGLTLVGAGIGQTNLTGGILMSGTFSDLTLKGFTVTGDAGGNFVVQGGQVTNLTVDGVRIDAQGVAGRHGFGSGQYGGAISITNSQFANIDGWVVFDTRSGAGSGAGTQIASGVFSNNTIDNSHGNVNFRQQTGAFAYPDIVIANNTVTNVGSSNNSFGAVFKVFNAGTVDFTGNSVSGVGTSGFNPAGEAPYGTVLMTRGVNQLNIVGNTFANNNQVLAIEPGRGLSTNTFLAGNTFTNNRYGIYMPNNAVAGGAVTFGAGNTFIAGADTVQHIVWRSAAGLDLTNVAFNGKLGSAMSLGELFDVEDLISHGTDVAGRGLARVKAGEIFVTTGSGSVQRGVDVAAQGDTVHVDAGTYALPGELRITKSLSLTGAGAGGTVFNSASTGYGVFVAADDVTLGGFTFNGNPAGSYGVKVQPNSANPGARLRGFAIADVAINGTRRTGLDLNGVVGAVIDGVTVTGAIAGNGISITDSADVVVRNTTTSGNAWGGLALYQANRFFDQQVEDIVVEAGNVFGEVRGLYTQDESNLFDFGGLALLGFDFTVRNDDFQPDAAGYTFYMTTLQGALDYGVALGAAGSYVQGWNGTRGDAHFYVGGGDAGAGRQFLSIQTAFDKSSAGSVIDILSGDYTGVATLTGQRDLRFGVVTLGGLNLTSGASGTVLSGDITATDGLDFDGAIVLGGDARLAAAGAIDIVGVDGSSDGQQSLAVEGQGLVYVGPVGASVALASLSIVGSDVIARGAVTTGDQVFAGGAVLLWGGFDAGGDFTVDGPTTLGGDTVVDSDGDMRLGAIDGEHNLSLNAGGAVTLGAIGATTALNGLNVLGASIDSDGANTVGRQSWNAAAVGLSGAYAAGGDITVNGATTLNGSTSLTSGDYVSLGPVDGAHDLTITAANFAILGPVGATTALSSLVVSADEIVAVGARTSGLQAFTGARVGLSGAFVVGGGFTVAGAAELNGDVAIEGDDVTFASVDGAHDLTVDADGAVSLGAVGSTTALASLDVSGASIASQGAITGGDQSYDAAAVGLSGAYAAGGDITVDGATVLTADASLDADGAVVLGAVDGAHALSIGAGGPASLGAAGGTTALANLDVTAAAIASHGAVTTGDQSYDAATVGLSGLYAAGGDFVVDGAAILDGATSIEADAVAMGTVDGARHLSIAADGAVSLGAIGATTALTGLDVSGASIVARGARTIGGQSWTGQAIRLAGGFATDNGDFGLIGLTTLDGATTIATNGGDVVAETIDGAGAGGQSLSIDAGAGAVSVGSMGAGARLGAVLVRSAGTVLNGATYAGSRLSFLGSGAGSTVRLTQASTTFDTAPTGSAAGGIVVQPDLIGTVNGAQSVVFNAGSGLGADNGDVTLGNAGSQALRLGSMTVSGDDFSARTVKLAGDFTSVLSGDQVFSANTLDTLANVDAKVGGDDSGPVIAGGAVTLATAGSSTGSIAAGGPVSVVAGGAVNQNIASTGAVAVTSTGASVTGAIQGGGVAVTAQGAVNTNVTATGAVAVTSTGGAVNGAIQGGAGVSIAAQGPITANVSTPGVVTVTSPQPVAVVVNAGSVVVNAPGGKVDGTFGSIATDPNGTIDVNGQTVIGAGSTDARQILIDQFLAPVGGVVGAGGQIRLPVNLAVALIAPAGQGDRRPIVVNSIDRLGELLRLGYTAIIVQLDSGAAYEQEIDLAAATEARPAG